LFIYIRFIRLGTDSLADDGVNQLIDTEKLDLKKVSSEKISRVLHILYYNESLYIYYYFYFYNFIYLFFFIFK